MDSTIIIAIIIWIGIRILAGMNIPVISIILRTWWNISFKIASFIPFCGWMTCFIIAKNEKERKEKEMWKKTGEETDNAAADMLERAAERDRAALEAEQARIAQKEAERKELEEDLRARTYRKYGTRDVHVNSDGSRVKVGGGEYIPTEEFKRKLF